MEEKKVRIPNITCGHCIATIQRKVGELDGVVSVKGDPETKTVTFRWETPADWETIAKVLEEIGYPAEHKD